VKDTCIYYARSRVESNVALDALLASGQIILCDPVPLAVLRRIRDGAAVSQHLALGHRQLLVDQGLIQ
jgi:hypothetical protein